MSERLDLADAACLARFQPNFQGGEAKGEDRPENAGLKTRDAPIVRRSNNMWEWRYSAGGHHSVTDPRVSSIAFLK